MSSVASIVITSLDKEVWRLVALRNFRLSFVCGLSWFVGSSVWAMMLGEVCLPSNACFPWTP